MGEQAVQLKAIAATTAQDDLVIQRLFIEQYRLALQDIKVFICNVHDAAALHPAQKIGGKLYGGVGIHAYALKKAADLFHVNASSVVVVSLDALDAAVLHDERDILDRAEAQVSGRLCELIGMIGMMLAADDEGVDASIERASAA